MEYAKESLTLGMIFLELKDAIREGDGTRVLRCWKYLFLLFRGSGHTNYCLEALILLAQYYYILPPRLAEQMIWGRFVNYEGKIGGNISADLHIEHLNRTCKEAIQHLGANLTPQAIVQCGKAIGKLTKLEECFDKMNGIATSGSHTRRSDGEDFEKIVQELMAKEVFKIHPGRQHSKFPKFQSNGIISSIKKNKFQKWMDDHLSELFNNSFLSR